MGGGPCSLLVGHGAQPSSLSIVGHCFCLWVVWLAIVSVGRVVVGCCGHWWWAIIGVDWGWWWVLAASHVTRCCCEQSSSCHCCVFITCPGSVVVVSYCHRAVVVVCHHPSLLSITIVLLLAFVVIVLCRCSCHIVSCHHLLVVKLVGLGQVCSLMDDGQQTRNLSLSMINVCMSVVGEEERTNVGG